MCQRKQSSWVRVSIQHVQDAPASSKPPQHRLMLCFISLCTWNHVSVHVGDRSTSPCQSYTHAHHAAFNLQSQITGHQVHVCSAEGLLCSLQLRSLPGATAAGFDSPA